MASARQVAIANFLLGTNSPGAAVTATAPAKTKVRAKGGTAYVGDSLGVGTTPYLRKQLGAVKSDAVVGRSSQSAVKALKGMSGYGRVVFDAGTNDGSASQLARSLRRADRVSGNAPIYVPKVHGPHAKEKNRVIRRAGGDIHLVKPGKQGIGPDGIHYSAQGYRRRAKRIAGQIG